ncbi:ATP-binding protein [Streptomyces sp. N35]|uniref:ATP-binding protein n=1 Tax=Streptomyces sp. N35 TaxID=2795730 RepID=UPI0018F589DD|nr:ATP-binding protein [Streptomyces sp. N35]
MQYVPPSALRGHDLEPLLAKHGLTSAWLATHDFDSHSTANVARVTYGETVAKVPFHYRSARTTLPQLHAWIVGLVAEAKRRQAERGAPIASITHGPSLLLLGATGVGKTYEAYGAMRELSVTGVYCQWAVTTAADLYAALRPRHGIDSEAEFRTYRDARLLLVDDLGADRKPTEFTEEINFRLINHRYEHYLPTLITTNVGPKELASRLGDRVASRLAEMCERIAIKGNDRRRAA